MLVCKKTLTMDVVPRTAQKTSTWLGTAHKKSEEIVDFSTGAIVDFLCEKSPLFPEVDQGGMFGLLFE